MLNASSTRSRAADGGSRCHPLSPPSLRSRVGLRPTGSLRRLRVAGSRAGNPRIVDRGGGQVSNGRRARTPSWVAPSRFLLSWVRILSGSDSILTMNYIIVESVRFGAKQTRNEGPGEPWPRRCFQPSPLEWVTSEDHKAAALAVLAANRRNLSFVDCTSFLVMRRLGLRSAFAFDRQFRQQGLSKFCHLERIGKGHEAEKQCTIGPDGHREAGLEPR